MFIEVTVSDRVELFNINHIINIYVENNLVKILLLDIKEPRIVEDSIEEIKKKIQEELEYSPLILQLKKLNIQLNNLRNNS